MVEPRKSGTPEERRAYYAAWRAKNIDKVRTQQRAYHHRHKEARTRYSKTAPRAKYSDQMVAAKLRGIPWELTFADWLTWWGDDLPRRGRKGADLCMARVGDTGPYRIGNIFKETMAANGKSGRDKRWVK